jgi:hypothetical protein
MLAFCDRSAGDSRQSSRVAATTRRTTDGASSLRAHGQASDRVAEKTLEVLLPVLHQEGIVGVREQMTATARAKVLNDCAVQCPADVLLTADQRMQQSTFVIDRHPCVPHHQAGSIDRLPALDGGAGGATMLGRRPSRDGDAHAAKAVVPRSRYVRTDGLALAATQIGCVVARQMQDALCKAKPRHPPSPQLQMAPDALTARRLARAEPDTRDCAQEHDEMRQPQDARRQARQRVPAGVAQSGGAQARPDEPPAAVSRPAPIERALPARFSRGAHHDALPAADAVSYPPRGLLVHVGFIGALDSLLEGRLASACFRAHQLA